MIYIDISLENYHSYALNPKEHPASLLIVKFSNQILILCNFVNEKLRRTVFSLVFIHMPAHKIKGKRSDEARNKC